MFKLAKQIPESRRHLPTILTGKPITSVEKRFSELYQRYNSHYRDKLIYFNSCIDKVNELKANINEIISKINTHLINKSSSNLRIPLKDVKKITNSQPTIKEVELYIGQLKDYLADCKGYYNQISRITM